MELRGHRRTHGVRTRAVGCAAALLAAACAAEQQDDASAQRAMIGAAAEGTAGEGIEEGEGEEGAAGDRDPAQDMAGAGATAEPTFGAVYEILAVGCGGGQNGCHITGMAAGLAMPDPDAAHSALVGVASQRCDGELLVAPGDADQSVLMTVLQGGADCVKAMPLGRTPLPDDEVGLIRAWIDAGAHED